jgi:hypothetical protein
MILFNFILYPYESNELKYLNGVQDFLLNYSFIWVVKTFKQKLFKRFFFPQPSFKKSLQKFIKSLPNWVQIWTSIQFPSLYCHQGISVPKMTLEISSCPRIDLSLSLQSTPSTQVLLLTCQGHTFMWSAVDATIHISSPYNQPIIFGSTIHHSFPPHSIAFKRSSIRSGVNSIQSLSRSP